MRKLDGFTEVNKHKTNKQVPGVNDTMKSTIQPQKAESVKSEKIRLDVVVETTCIKHVDKKS